MSYPTRDFCLEHFLYRDNTLYTIKRWSPRVMIGKTQKSVCINGSSIDREEIIWIYNNGNLPEEMTVKNGLLIDRSDLGGRPRGSKSTYKRKNTLTREEEIRLVAEYHLLSQTEIRTKYNISRNQLSSIMRRFKLRKKDLSSYIKGNHNADSLYGICGVYAILRMDNCKAYIGSSKDVGRRLQYHLRDLSKGKHFNKDLQSDWVHENFYFSLIEKCDEKDLISKENEILNNLDPYCFYNKTFIKNKEIDYSDVWSRILNNSTTTNEGCIEYNTKAKKNGYVWISYKGKRLQTHRVSFFGNKWYTPNHINHTCCNKKCCNPDHLTETTAGENVGHYYSLLKPGERSSLYLRSEEIRSLLEEGLSYRRIIERLDLDISVSALSRFVIKALR